MSNLGRNSPIADDPPGIANVAEFALLRCAVILTAVKDPRLLFATQNRHASQLATIQGLRIRRRFPGSLLCRTECGLSTSALLYWHG